MNSKTFCLLCLFGTSKIFGATFFVDTSVDTLTPPAAMTSLREALQLAGVGDTIDCTLIAGSTISLIAPLPPVRFSMTITGNTVPTGASVIIDGSSLYQAFSVASGTVSISKFHVQNTHSLGGSGGNGFSGGGGGGGGGGALYIHESAIVTVTDCQFSANKATGGQGGAGIATAGTGSGGGGGGFGGGNGGLGGALVAGGGGGGNTGGGNGGIFGAPAGGNALATSFGGGGGAATGGMGGSSGSVPPFAGAAAGAGGGGGGGGAGAAAPAVPATTGGSGGDGIPAGLLSYGTGGGGGGGPSFNGGQGFNSTRGSGGGGGGGSTTSTGGTGGLYAGGGGGGAGIGGTGGIGGGGGGGTTGGTSQFGGGAGGSVSGGSGGAGGGGGAGLGGAIFIQQNGTLIITETTTGGIFSLQGNSVTAGAGGTGATAGAAGKALGNDFFITSTGLLNLQLRENFEIATNIESNLCGTPTGCTPTSGLTINSPNGSTLTLSGVNTYTGTTTITAGTLKVNADSGLGDTATPTSITFPVGSTGILQAGGTINSPSRAITLSGPGTFDTPTGTSFTFGGVLSGAGTMTKTGPGLLKFSGSNGAYSGVINVQVGTLAIGGASSTPLGTGTVNLFDATTLQVGSDYTSTGTIPNNLVFLPPQTGKTVIDAQGNAKWGGVVSGTAPFIKNGPGAFVLSGANTFVGDININAGTLGATTNAALGNLANKIFISNATLQAAGSFTTQRETSLNGNSSIEVLPTFTLTHNGVISGPGSLTKTNTGTLVLQPTTPGTSNTYLGGTTIAGGVLRIFADSALGSSTGLLRIQTATLQLGASLTLTRPVSIDGAAIIDTMGFQVTIPGTISGTGASVEKQGAGTLIVTGTNSFAGTWIITTGTLQGNTRSLIGNIQDSGILIFDQPSGLDGAYAGVLSSSGTFIKQGAGKVTFTADSSAFSGPVFVNGGNLAVNGKLGGSNTITINSGGTLSGTGQVANIITNSGGNLSPGDLVGILTASGNVHLNAGSTFNANITPTNGGLLNVAGSTTISSGSKVLVIPSITSTGFYGVRASYTIIRGPTISGTFGSVESTNPNFIPSLTYPDLFDQNGNKLFSTVQLNLIITQPFLNFRADTLNERRVARNIDAIGEAGTLISDTPLFNALETLTGQTDEVINDALDQMHPAQYSATVEMQNEINSGLLTLFHRKPMPACYCSDPVRMWVEPFGSWLQEKPKRTQIGFKSRTQGVALGFDGKVLDRLVIGAGGAWDYNHLSWARGRGKANGNGWYVGVYTDFTTDHYYFGFSCLGGRNRFHTQRHIQFHTVPTTNPTEVIPATTVEKPLDKHAFSHLNELNLMGQLSSAFMFGPDKCVFFPYINADFFYTDIGSFREKKAPGLNLHVRSTSSATFRGETGLGIQVQDTNYTETVCIAPQVLLGWAVETPIYRQRYRATFENQTIPFHAHGWDTTWQLFTVDFGLSVTFDCYAFSGAYHLELQPDDHSSLFNQRCNFRFNFTW